MAADKPDDHDERGARLELALRSLCDAARRLDLARLDLRRAAEQIKGVNAAEQIKAAMHQCAMMPAPGTNPEKAPAPNAYGAPQQPVRPVGRQGPGEPLPTAPGACSK